MLNRKFFNQSYIEVIRIIRNSNMNEKEKRHRRLKAYMKIRKMLKNEKIDNHYYSLVHEIKTYDLLKKYGKITIASDSINEKGPDIKLNQYNVECVCCSAGLIEEKLEKYRLSEYKKSVICDYNEKLELLLPRITSSLKEKSDKYKKYIDSRNYSKK